MILLAVVIGGAFFWQWQKASTARHLWASDETAETLSSIRFQKITGIGQATVAAISPDGKLVAYTNTTGGKQSLWLRQLATETNAQLLPPQNENFYGLRFSHNGEYIYFSREELNLYRISPLGGVPTLVLKNADGFS